MISEKRFDEKDRVELANTPLKSEMAVANEWISREDAHPDQLYAIFVSPDSYGDLQIACACPRGTMDQTCPHALDVLDKCRADESILAQLFKRNRRPSTPVVAGLFH